MGIISFHFSPSHFTQPHTHLTLPLESPRPPFIHHSLIHSFTHSIIFFFSCNKLSSSFTFFVITPTHFYSQIPQPMSHITSPPTWTPFMHLPCHLLLQPYMHATSAPAARSMPPVHLMQAATCRTHCCLGKCAWSTSHGQYKLSDSLPPLYRVGLPYIYIFYRQHNVTSPDE